MNIKLIIKNKLGEILQTAIFEDQKHLDDFKILLSYNAPWGKHEHQRELTPRIHNEDGTITEATYETVPSEYFLEEVDVTLEIEEAKRKEELKLAGAKAREACNSVLDLISGYNISRSLTSQQITDMSTLFAPIVQCLMISRPSTAKSLISQVVPDNTLITEQIKTDILNELKDY